jgi:hypothetical protein
MPGAQLRDIRRIRFTRWLSAVCAITAIAVVRPSLLATPCPVISTNLDDTVLNVTSPIPFLVWIEKPEGVTLNVQETTLLFFANDHISIEPNMLNLDVSGKTRSSATLSFKGDNVGLVTLKGKLTGWPSGCAELDLPIDTGFSSIAKLTSDLVTTDPQTGLRLHLTGGQQKSFTILFKNQADKDLQLGSPVTVILEATDGAKLSVDSKKWDTKTTVNANQGSTQTEPVLIRPPSGGSETDARIYVHVHRNSASNDLLNGTIVYDFDYPWWLRLLSIIAGCLIYSAIEALSSKRLGKFSWDSLWVKLFLMLAIGVLAYVIEDSKILGFEVSKTTIKGNVMFGVLVGCLGLEGIINRIRDFVHGAPPTP